MSTIETISNATMLIEMAGRAGPISFKRVHSGILVRRVRRVVVPCRLITGVASSPTSDCDGNLVVVEVVVEELESFGGVLVVTKPDEAVGNTHSTETQRSESKEV